MSELEKKGDEQLNHLLSMSLDVESLFFLVQKEEDTDTKQVHFYLFKVTRANDMKKKNNLAVCLTCLSGGTVATESIS